MNVSKFRFVILGGGTAGWMTVSALSRLFDPVRYSITLIESPVVGSVGVGEATIPHIRQFNEMVGISEDELITEAEATYKLGIQFNGWGRQHSSYFHPFGSYGADPESTNFHEILSAAKKQNSSLLDLQDYSFAIEMCRNNKFTRPQDVNNFVANTYSYAYHFDASLYANLLKKKALSNGTEYYLEHVERIDISQTTGQITSVSLANGDTIHGDFFLDCSGQRSLILSKTLSAEFEDWSKWLPCDSAAFVGSSSSEVLFPYTISEARSAGWQWRIPLQHRTGNGYVFSSRFISDEEAIKELTKNINSNLLCDPKIIRFTSGRYKKSWKENCVAIGLSSGFLEPLESTSIHLIQVAIRNFIYFFREQDFQVQAQAFNKSIDMEYERIRDFLILHYYLNQREDSDFWRYCRAIDIPDSLKRILKTYNLSGYIETHKYGLFNLNSWISVLNGQGENRGFGSNERNLEIESTSDKFSKLRTLVKRFSELSISHNEQIIKIKNGYKNAL